MIISGNKRTILGAFILVIVNVIWVLSSELTNYIFQTEHYSKPYLSTYLKSSIFSLFLFGFFLSAHWRMLACPHRYYNSKYFRIENSEEEKTILSDPVYVPVNFEASEDETNVKQGNDSAHYIDDDYVFVDQVQIDEYQQQNEIAKRSVKFSKYSEVRHLSDTYAEDSIAARMSYNASKALKKRLMIRRIIEQGYLPAINVAMIAFQFCFLWFIANFSYQEGLAKESPAVVNIISCTSSLFTLILAAIFPSTDQDKFNVTKLIVVLFSMSGVVLLSFSEYIDTQKFNIEGIIWSLVSAFGYAAYLVNLRRKVQNENQMSLPMFFGFVGFWTIVCLWPGLIILNITEFEKFELPNRIQLGSMLVNGFIGTLGAELLWLWGCFLTSSIAATLSLGLSIPLSMVADYLIKKKVYNWKFYLGSIPILFSFIVIAYLTNDSTGPKDPIGRFLKIIFCKTRDTSTYEPLAETDSDSEDDRNESRFSNLQTEISHSINSDDQASIDDSKIIYTGISKKMSNELPILSNQNKFFINEKKNVINSEVLVSTNLPSINTNNDLSNDRQ